MAARPCLKSGIAIVISKYSVTLWQVHFLAMRLLFTQFNYIYMYIST
jgi:hypothetical protein